MSKALFKLWSLDRLDNASIKSDERCCVFDTVQDNKIQLCYCSAVSSGKYLSNH